MRCLAVDLGGTHLRCGVVSERDELIAYERMTLPDALEARTDTIWATIVSRIARFAIDHQGDVEADAPIVFAFPGPVLADGASGQAPTVARGLPVPDLPGELRARTGRAVLMLNDVSAAAYYFEDRLNAERFAIVTVSSGIGSKIFDRRYGPGVVDDIAYAGEIGHLVVESGDDASICDCGGRGHLGAVASGRGFERRARRQAEQNKAAFAASACVRTFGATASTLNNEEHLVPSIALGDAWAVALLHASIAPLAEVLRVLTVGCGLGAVAVVGGFAQRIGAAYGHALNAAIGTVSDCGAACIELGRFVTVADFDQEPALIGAARYAKRRRAAA